MHITSIDFTELSLKLIFKLSISKLSRKAKTARRKQHYCCFTGGEPKQRMISTLLRLILEIQQLKMDPFLLVVFLFFSEHHLYCFVFPVKHDLANNSNLPLPVSRLLNILFSSLVVCSLAI